MKRSIYPFLLLILLTVTGSAAGQDCEFNVIGTWKADIPGASQTVLYRFTPDGVFTVLSTSPSAAGGAPQEIATATYELDNPRAPKTIALTTTNKSRVLLYGKSSIKVVEHTDASMTCMMPGSGPTRWIKVDPNRYFIVLAAREKIFYDRSGPAFPILIKLAGREAQIDAVGTYSDHGKSEFGRVPPEAYKDFMKEPGNESTVMLRLELNSGQYERGLKILQTWDRRVREGALLYPVGNPLNNILLVKAITETLNQCGEEFKLYKLNYLHPEDWIADEYDPQYIPFVLFKELRKLNESRHVRDDKFQQAQAALPSGQPQGN